MDEVGYQEDDICNRDGCPGTMVFQPENCSCHISPPCGACINGLQCDTCLTRSGPDGDFPG
jgi:hypothetical protein